MWGFSNGTGAVQLVDPGAALTGAERAEGQGVRCDDSETPTTFQPPGAGHSVAAMEEDDAGSQGTV